MLIPVDRDTLSEACLMLAVHERDIAMTEAQLGLDYTEYYTSLRRVSSALLAALAAAGAGVTWAGVSAKEIETKDNKDG